MRRKLVIAGVLAVVLLGGFGLYWFQPWKLVTTKAVHEKAPVVVASPSAAAAVLLAGGKLIAHEHSTSGTVELVKLPDGKVQLVLRDLSTSDGPDVRVWLTDQPVIEGSAGWHVFDDGKYVELGKLRGTHGTLVYDVPPDVQLDQYTSVTLWCKRFSVSFGAATLA